MSSEQVSKKFFPPHTSILNRILHDPSLKKEEYVMGYIDRFDEMKEVSVVRWVERRSEGVVGEEWVPGHRVAFLKRVGKNTDVTMDESMVAGKEGQGEGAVGEKGDEEETGEKEEADGNGDETTNTIDDEEYYNITKPSLSPPSNPSSNPSVPPTTTSNRNRKTKPEEPWDGTLTEDLPWDSWTKRGIMPSVDIEGNGKIEGEIVWDRRRRVDLISGVGK